MFSGGTPENAAKMAALPEAKGIKHQRGTLCACAGGIKEKKNTISEKSLYRAADGVKLAPILAYESVWQCIFGPAIHRVEVLVDACL